jgi:hypothetical protein
MEACPSSLHGAQIGSGLDHVRGVAVAQRVRAHALSAMGNYVAIYETAAG